MREVHCLGARMHPLTMDETIEQIDGRIAGRTFTQHVVVNVAKIVYMQSDAELSNSVNSCDIINVDGMGVVWGARFLGFDIPERVSSVDLFDRLLELAAVRGYPVFLLGATDEVVAKTVDVANNRHPGLIVAGFHHGYFWANEEAMVDAIRASGARLLFVAISSPKKENFINRWRHQLGVDFVMGVGGTFDVIAGKVKRAPIWMQKAGLEWFYRVIQEPGRMWRRYAYTNIAFGWLLLTTRLGRLFRRRPA